MRNYDVIIAGASFAGLAVASRINKGKVLLIDRNEIGANQTSACGTTVKMVKEVRCEKAILKTFDIIAIHTKNREIDIPLPDPFCTIDYEKFCKTLAKQSKVEFLKADVKGVKDSTVMTSKGDFKADIIVDCTGWQAVLASSLRKDYVNRKMVSFGIETEIPYEDNKLRFFVDPAIIKNGAAWLFPCEKTARFGVGSYSGNTKILPELKRFVGSYGLKIGRIHGGYFCYCLKDPVVEDVFMVGCSAGQTLPLGGEGIRRSVHFGLRCGEIIQKILDKQISLEQGQKEYNGLALRHRKYYNYLLKMQNRLPHTSNFGVNLVAGLLSIKPIAKWAWRKYEKI